jgi:hypothetical protein
MIAPRRPPPSRLVRVRWRPLPAARGLRRRTPRAGAGWVPVGLRWRRVARPVSGAAAPLPPRAANHRPRDPRPGWRTRTLLLPAAPAPGRNDAPRGLPGARGAAGQALRGEAGRHGAMLYRAGLRPQLQAPSYLPPAQSPPPVRQLLVPAMPAAMPGARVAAARLEWMHRPQATAAGPVPQRAPGRAATPVRQRAPVSPLVRWRSPAETFRPGSVRIAGTAPRAQALALPAGGASQRVETGVIHAAARIDRRVRTHGPVVAPRAAAAIVRALARRAELVWRTAAASAESGAAATPGMALRHSASREHADTPGAAASWPATSFTAGAPAAPAMLDAAATERLVEDVLRRAEQRLRIERERRGL